MTAFISDIAECSSSVKEGLSEGGDNMVFGTQDPRAGEGCWVALVPVLVSFLDGSQGSNLLVAPAGKRKLTCLQNRQMYDEPLR